MGATGVNPLTDERWAFHHSMDILKVCPSEVDGAYVLSDTSLWLLRRLLTVAQDDEKHPVPADLLVRARQYPDIIAMLLKLVDVDLEKDLPTLLRFFIEFDPTSPLASNVLDLTFRGLSTTPAVEEEAFSLLCAMLDGGSHCAPLFEQGVSSVLYYGYMDLAYVGGSPDTILFRAVRSGVLSNVRWLLTRPSARAVKKLVCAVNTSNVTCLQWVVETLTPNESDDAESFTCDVVRLLLNRGSPTTSSTIDLFTLSTNMGYGGLGYELLPYRTDRRSLLLSLSPLGLGQLCRRYIDTLSISSLGAMEDIVDARNTSPPDARMEGGHGVGVAPLRVLDTILGYCDEETSKVVRQVSASFYYAALLPQIRVETEL